MADTDPWANWTYEAPAYVPPTPAPSADPWAGWTNQGPGARPSQPISRLQSAGEGALDTTSFGFRDEIKGLSDASGLPSWAGGYRAPVGIVRLLSEKMSAPPIKGEKPSDFDPKQFTPGPGPVEQTYNAGTEGARQFREQAEAQNPGSFLTGQVVGAVATPGGVGGSVPKAATNVLTRARRAARIGATQGGLYGVGSGEDTTDRATRGVVGTLVGGVTAGAASPTLDVVLGTGSKLGPRDIYRGIRSDLNPAWGKNLIEDEASKSIQSELTNDFLAGGPKWTPDTIRAANRSGVPISIADTGGEGTLGLARSAANQSPQARSALKSKADETFAGQKPRTVQLVSDWYPGADRATDLEASKASARAANRPAYKNSYAIGDRDLLSESPDLQTLVSSPSVLGAMKGAISKWKDWQILDGYGAMNPPVSMKGGRMVFGDGGLNVFPNLQLWDYTARDLAGKAAEARRAGNMSETARFGGLEQRVKAALDAAVPEFKDARQGAAKFFDADNAFEAGGNFVSSRGENSEYALAHKKFSPEEKDQFAKGFALKLADRVRELAPGQNILKQAFVTSDASRQRIEMAMGPDRARELEAHLRAEGLVDRLREALGNSTTVRQLAEIGLLTGGSALTLGHAGTADEWDMRHILGSALLAGGAFGKYRAGVFNRELATRAGEMLASGDRNVLKRGTAMVAKNADLMEALRAISDKVDLVVAKGTPRAAGGLTDAIATDRQQQNRQPQ